MTIDRAELEKAITHWDSFNSGHHSDDLRIVLAAARAHLETLPRTKMVEVKRWVAFRHDMRSGGGDNDRHYICNLSAFTVEQPGLGQWVTFKVEVPA